MKLVCSPVFPAVAFICTLGALAHGSNGTWTNVNGGSWTDAGNWLGGIAADGSGFAADFTTLNLSGDVLVTLDGSRTIGGLSFDDLSPIKHAWTIETGSGGSLTLAGGTPVVTVLSSPVTINASVVGAAGLRKSGPGRLFLAGANNLSGTTTVDAGILGEGDAALSASSPLIISPGAVVESFGTLSIQVNASSTAIGASGSGMLRLAATTNGLDAPDLYFGPNHVANTDWGARLATPLDLGNSQRYIYGKTGHNGVGPYGLTGADCQFAGPISGAGGLTIIAQNSWTGTDPMEASFALNAANTFTGPVDIRRGSFYLGNANALTHGNVLSFNPGSANNARLFLYGHNASVSDLSSAGNGNALIANGNLPSGATVTLGSVTLTVTQGTNTTYGGVLVDTYPEYTGSGSGTTGPLSLLKNGPGALRFTGACGYTGSTTVGAGLLEVDGSLGPGAVFVGSGAALAGIGTISGPVTISSGANLLPGDDTIGTLTINNALSLAGNTIMELEKIGTSLPDDQIAGVSRLVYGGSLLVTNIGNPRSGVLSAGDSFTLFTAGDYSGSFSNLNLPVLSGTLAWDTSNLWVNGSITVVDPASGPVVVMAPQDQLVASGSSVSFSAVAAGSRPLSYQWQKNSDPIPGATGTSLAVASVGTNDVAQYEVVITNLYGSVTSTVASLTLLPPGSSSITNGLWVYLNFDGNLDPQSGTTNGGSLYTGGATRGPRYKPGVIGSAATFANTATAGQPDDWAVSLGNLDMLYTGSFSVSLWERTPTSGDGALIGNKNWSSGANVGWVISSLDMKNVNWNAVGGTRRDVELNPPFSDGTWHLVTITLDRSANQVISYLDGAAVNMSDISPSGSASLNAGFNTLVGSSGNGTYSGTADLDDLGIWNRVLNPQEIAGIYGAGLRHEPLVAARVGTPPLIDQQPAHLSATTGSSATFSVAANGPGPLSYQWKFNGTDIPGATDSTLVLPSVNAASQGVYTVVVDNGTGAVLSSGAVLTVYELAVTGQWDFQQGDLRATVGADLEYLGDTASLTSFPFDGINGQLARVLAFGSNAINQGFYMRHGAQPNGGGHFVNQYTLVMDIMFPASSAGQWRALFQTDPFNHDGNDAEFYVGNASAAPDHDGLGAEGQFDGSLSADRWHRIAFAVNLAAPAGQQLSKYIDGVKVGSQSLSGGIDGRFALGPAALLFTAGISGGGVTQAGFVNSIQFMNGCLTPEAVAALGGPSAAGLPPGNGVLQISGISRNGSLLHLTWTGAAGSSQLQTTAGLKNPQWEDLGGLTTNGAIAVPLNGATAFYRVRQFRPDIQVGPLGAGTQSIPSKQLLRSAGQQIQFAGRPVDLALSPDGRTIFIKNINSLLVVDVASWRVVQTLNYPGSGASMHGIAVSPAGTHVYATGCGNELYDWAVATNGLVSFSRTISLPNGSNPCGLALSPDGATAYVCLSIPNALAVVDLNSGTVSRQIGVGIAPWDLALSPDGATAYVSDWGGRLPVAGDLTATSAGSHVVVDSRGVAASGTVSFVNLVSGLETAEVPTGLHPSDLELSADGNTLFVANANSDTVTVMDTRLGLVKETILVRPDPSFAYGSASDGLALSKDGQSLFVAEGGNNAVAVIELPNNQHTNSVLQGFIPCDWYPGAVVADSNHLYVANVKGLGSRLGQPAVTSWQIGAFLGTAAKIPVPPIESLSKFTAQVFEDGRVPQIRQTQLMLRPGQPPVPVPVRVGEPSVFQHVLYILKENKTYDQMFGDLGQGNGNAGLCTYPRLVSPNHHALAEQYVLLDNFYCNGVNSADGHSWSTEGNDTDYIEKSLGGLVRSGSFGDDALTYSSTGFIWNNAIEHGLSFRNYGEFDYASPVPANATWLQMYMDFTNGTHSIQYAQNIGVTSLRPYSSTNVPGWNLNIPDLIRADGFIKEFHQAELSGTWETFHLLYLPNDHTGGPPSPRAQVADNDLALGRVVEAVTKSAFASNTVIFVIEDDPQSGFDHVDGHRSICLVISPYTRRGQVLSTFYNQAGVLHTMEQIMGLPPMNQQDAMAPLMFDCFTNAPDFTPYTALPNTVPLTEGVVATGSLPPKQMQWAKKLRSMDFSKPDRINEDLFNRYIWYSIKGDAPYPAEFAGSHGKGLKRLGLVLDRSRKDADD